MFEKLVIIGIFVIGFYGIGAILAMYAIRKYIHKQELLVRLDEKPIAPNYDRTEIERDGD